MQHLIISREYPPTPYAPGGIGTYAANIARMMAEQGETVHIIAQRWSGAPKQKERFHHGRVIVHRIGESDLPKCADPTDAGRFLHELDGLKASEFPNQWFAWHAAFLAERLIDLEGFDVIEGQEWEAPLYYLLLRRALGMGPPRSPPCIVHLHSASAFIHHFNGAFSTPRAAMLVKRMEEFCVRSADALLCPSHYFADQCSTYFGLPRESIEVIRLPVGSTPILERSSSVWANGGICFVGRLEPRKGIIEWIEAATRVACEDPTVHFDFVGADNYSLLSVLKGRLKPELRSRFRFHGSKSREDVLPYLAAAKAAVVPSRWENFPNVCVEAMSSGLPVIATRLGGMIELVEDGRTGWLTPDTGVSGMVDGLAQALRRCLAASQEERASMGLAAAYSVRRTCDNEKVVSAQISFRANVALRGAWRSLSLARPPQSLRSGEPMPAATRSPSEGAAIVVRTRFLSDAEPVLMSLGAQSRAPRAIAIVYAESPSGAMPADITRSMGVEAIILCCPEINGTDAWNAGFEALQGVRDIGYWLFLDHYDRLAPICLERLEQIFAHRPEVGLIATWTLRKSGPPLLEAPLCAELIHQLTGNDATPASAFRAHALPTPPFRSGMPREYDIWDVANALLLKGWAAAPLPEALAMRYVQRPQIAWPQVTALRAIRAELLSRFAETATQTALDLVDDYVPLPWAATQPPFGPPLQRPILRYLATILFHPRRVFCALARRSIAVRQRIGLRTKGVIS
jgi:glycogen(starch) synthase